MSRATLIRTESIDFLEAAAIYRRSRHGGVAVRKLVDCLICAVAIRAGATVVHRDKDFDLIARHTAIRLDRSEDRAGP
jgi:predicted nucleic acid-binding protein